MSYNLGGGECPPLQPPNHQHQYVSTSNTFTSLTSSPSPLLLAPLPDGVLGLVREGAAPGSSLPLPPAIVQITQPLSRTVLSEGGVTSLMSRAGDVRVTSVSLRSTPISIPARSEPQPLHSASVSLSRQSAGSPMLEDNLGAGDYITLTSNNTALVFNSATQSHDRGSVVTFSYIGFLLQFRHSLIEDLVSEVPLDSITLDSDRNLGEESPVSLNTANTRVILTSSLGSQSASGYSVSVPGSGLSFPGPAASSSGVSITSQPSISSTAQLVTISQGSISLPVVGVGPGGQLLTQSPGPGSELFSSDHSGYSGPEPLPTLMSPREVSLLSPPMTRDQMMSSTMMPRDQMLASNVNPMSKLMSVTGKKDQTMSSSRGKSVRYNSLSVAHSLSIFRPTVVYNDISNGCNNLISFTNL